MTRTNALLLAGLAVLVAGCAGEPRSTAPLSPRATAALEAVTVDPAAAARIMSEYRASKGLGPVRLDPVLSAMAQRQADAMAAANSLSHDVGGSFTARVHGAGLDATYSAENLGAGYDSTQDAFAGWRKSSGHDRNLLMPQATRIGIALAKDPHTRYRSWWALVIAGEPEKRREMNAGPVGYFGSTLPRPR